MIIGIFGTKSEAIYLSKQLVKSKNVFVKCFIDNNSKLWGNMLDGKPVISFCQMKEQYEKEIDAIIVAVRGMHSRLCIIQQLRKNGIEKVGIFKFSAHDFQKRIKVDNEGNSEYIVWLDKIDRPVLPYLETNVMDCCNLKCKGCTHFANLFNESSQIELQQYICDLTQIAKKTYIIQLRLLGGEPLLNKELYKIVEASRKILPYADIEIVTNGLLIPKQEDILFESMRHNRVGFLISKYKPTMKNQNTIKTILRKKKVDYYFEREIIYEFGRTLSMKGNSNTDLSQEVCISRGCRFFRNGYLYKCPFEGLVDIFAIKYGYKDVLKVKRGFYIYDEEIDWEEKLNNFLMMPVAMCSFCAEKCEMFKWEVTNVPEKEDWLVQ